MVEPTLWEKVEQAALGLFIKGTQIAQQAGLILVDTKYEFGVVDDTLVVIDEIHTPDSSRYWLAESYGKADDPENYDKEFLRKWFVNQGFRGEGEPPKLTNEVIVEAAQRYIALYERLTGQTFVPGEKPSIPRITQNLDLYRQSLLK
jgi:phosphoribosylaminoimidazole-succinocarboxamide synthase